MSESKHTIPDFDGYAATISGHIYSTKSNWRGIGCRKLAADLNSHGYPRVRLTIAGGKRRSMAIHRLMAATFLPPRPSAAHEVRHLDGNKTNNAASNLKWGTRKENAEDRARHGRTSSGARHSAAIKAGLAYGRASV